MEIKKAIVKYDVTVGKYDDFPRYTDKQLARQQQIENACLEVFRVLAEDPDLGFVDINMELIYDFVDIAADYLCDEKGLSVYFPETRNCIDSETGKATKYRCIQNYYNQWEYRYNEKGEVIGDNQLHRQYIELFK